MCVLSFDGTEFLYQRSTVGYIHNGFINYHDCTVCKIVSYGFDCQHEASVGEEDCANWNTEVAAEHVHDV